MTRRGALIAALHTLALVWMGQATLDAGGLLRTLAGQGMAMPPNTPMPGPPVGLAGGMVLLLAAAAFAAAIPGRVATLLDPGHPPTDRPLPMPLRVAAVLVGLVFATLGLAAWVEALSRVLPVAWEASGPGPRTLTALVRPVDASGWAALIAPLLPVLYGTLLIAGRRRVAELAARRTAREHAP